MARIPSRKYAAWLAVATPKQLRTRWRRRLQRIEAGIAEQYRRVRVYRDLVEVVRANPATLRPPVFFNWGRDNYAVALCLGIRRLLDASEDVASLGRLLREVRARPEAVTLGAFRAMARRRGVTSDRAGAMFRERAGVSGTHLTAAKVGRDIQWMDAAGKKVKRLVDKRLAHATPLNRIAALPTFPEIEEALEILDQVFVRYDALIGGGGLATAYPHALSWRRVLERPWVVPARAHLVPVYGGPRHITR